jgi:hypothetical protein
MGGYPPPKRGEARGWPWPRSSPRWTTISRRDPESIEIALDKAREALDICRLLGESAHPSGVRAKGVELVTAFGSKVAEHPTLSPLRRGAMSLDVCVGSP